MTDTPIPEDVRNLLESPLVNRGRRAVRIQASIDDRREGPTNNLRIDDMALTAIEALC